MTPFAGILIPPTAVQTANDSALSQRVSSSQGLRLSPDESATLAGLPIRFDRQTPQGDSAASFAEVIADVLLLNTDSESTPQPYPNSRLPVDGAEQPSLIRILPATQILPETQTDSTNAAVAQQSGGADKAPESQQHTATPSLSQQLASIDDAAPNVVEASANTHDLKSHATTDRHPQDRVGETLVVSIADDTGRVSSPRAGYDEPIPKKRIVLPHSSPGTVVPLSASQEPTTLSEPRGVEAPPLTEPRLHNHTVKALQNLSASSVKRQSPGTETLIGSEPRPTADAPPSIRPSDSQTATTLQTTSPPVRPQSADSPQPAGLNEKRLPAPTASENADVPRVVENPSANALRDGSQIKVVERVLDQGLRTPGNPPIKRDAESVGERKAATQPEAAGATKVLESYSREKQVPEANDSLVRTGRYPADGRGQTVQSFHHSNGPNPEADLALPTSGRDNGPNLPFNTPSWSEAQTVSVPIAQPFRDGPPATAAPSAAIGGTKYDTGVVIENLARDIVERARVVTGPGETRIEIELDPPELGRVSVRLSESSDGISARIVVAHENVWRSVSQGMADFQTALSGAGIELRDFSLAQREGDATQQFDDSAQPARQPNQNSPTDTPAYNGRHSTRTESARVVDIRA